ncbi:MAG: hypothetical protein Q8M92_00925, partial [Candidatus Subteraquimicrobiales bacterium]|nr:hypothetical protein [Candidatus Subteraquimicrobiales bacterium]
CEPAYKWKCKDCTLWESECSPRIEYEYSRENGCYKTKKQPVKRVGRKHHVDENGLRIAPWEEEYPEIKK